MGVIKRIEPLMINNKLAVVRINNLIDAVAGDITTPVGGDETTLGGTVGVAIINGGTLNLHTAVGYANKRVVVKATGNPVAVKAEDGEFIDNEASVAISGLDAIELISDNENWWIMSSHALINDAKIIDLLENLVNATRINGLHLEVITDEKFEEGESEDADN